jgi:DNA-binding MurR/RpiR family transcriptional regulator
MVDEPNSGGSTFDQQVSAALPGLSPAEQRVARLFVEQKEAILLISAAEVGALIGTSDATVVRTAQSLGFDSLSSLREALLSDLTGRPTPSGRLRRTLDETGDDVSQALEHAISIHEATLQVLKTPEFRAQYARAVDILLAAKQRRIFGIGPSGALAEYTALQFSRIGLTATPLSATGIALADRLLGLAEGDAVLMIAYAPVYREVTATLDHAKRIGVPVVLVSDSLGPYVSDRVTVVLPVPRGKAGHLSLHGGTTVLLEALVVGLAGRNRAGAFGSLETLASLRGAIDKSWLKRGDKRSYRKIWQSVL